MKNSVVIPSHESCKTVKFEASKIPRSYDYFTVHEPRKKNYAIIRVLHRMLAFFFLREKKNPIKVLPFQPFCGLSVNIPMHSKEMAVKWGFLDISHLSITQRYTIFRHMAIFSVKSILKGTATMISNLTLQFSNLSELIQANRPVNQEVSV